MMFINIFIHKRRAAKPSCKNQPIYKNFLPFDSIFWSSTFWFSFFRVLASDYGTSFLSQSCLRWIFSSIFRALKGVFTDSGKSCHLYHFRAQWIVVWSVSLSSFWQGAFASIDICRLLTGLFGYCVFSLLADHIDWWLPKSFAEKWSYETYLACNCEHISRGATRYCDDLSLHFLHWK